MLELDAMFFAVAVPAVAFAGVSKGGFGSGAAFASAAILAVYLDPGQALALMLPLLMLIDVATLGPYWKRWNWPDAKLLILGGIPGVVIGAALYRIAPPDLIRFLIGSIALLFVAWQLARRQGCVQPPANRLPPPVGALAGAVAGFTSFVSHAGGPPAAVYLLSQRLDKSTYQATTVLVFWAINIAKFVPYAFLGLFSAQTFYADLLLAPAALAGVWIGVRLHRRISESLFFAITYVALGLTGAKLISDALN